MKNKIIGFIINHWVSWSIEIVAMLAIAFFTISEAKKTGEETRAILLRFEEKIGNYASGKAEAVENAVSSGKEAVKEKFSEIDKEDIKEAAEATKEAAEDFAKNFFNKDK